MERNNQATDLSATLARMVVDADKDKAKLKALREYLANDPSIAEIVALTETCATGALMGKLTGGREGQRAALDAEFYTRLASLLQDGDSQIEQLLARRVLVCWLNVVWAENAKTLVMNTTQTLAYHEFIDKQLSRAETRFNRACESLAKVRAMLSAGRAVKAQAEILEVRSEMITERTAAMRLNKCKTALKLAGAK